MSQTNNFLSEAGLFRGLRGFLLCLVAISLAKQIVRNVLSTAEGKGEIEIERKSFTKKLAAGCWKKLIYISNPSNRYWGKLCQTQKTMTA